MLGPKSKRTGQTDELVVTKLLRIVRIDHKLSMALFDKTRVLHFYDEGARTSTLPTSLLPRPVPWMAVTPHGALPPLSCRGAR